jgi:hypothetical protein
MQLLLWLSGCACVLPDPSRSLLRPSLLSLLSAFRVCAVCVGGVVVCVGSVLGFRRDPTPKNGCPLTYATLVFYYGPPHVFKQNLYTSKHASAIGTQRAAASNDDTGRTARPPSCAQRTYAKIRSASSRASAAYSVITIRQRISLQRPFAAHRASDLLVPLTR